MAERVREADQDLKDRNKEQEGTIRKKSYFTTKLWNFPLNANFSLHIFCISTELEEIKTKIFSGEFENPTQEFERIKKEREEMYKPKILIDVNLEQEKQREREVQRERERDAERQNIKDRERAQKERYVEAKASRELASLDAEPIESTDSSNDADSPHNPHNNNSERVSSTRGSESHDLHSNINGLLDEDSRSSLKSSNSPISAETPPPIAPGISLNLNANAKKKRIEVKDIFNSEDDSEDINGPKKRKLVPLGTEISCFRTNYLFYQFIWAFLRTTFQLIVSNPDLFV